MEVFNGGTSGNVTVSITPPAATPTHILSAAGTNATSLKGSSGDIFSIEAFNTNASPRYLKLYDSASAPTAGSGTPVKVIAIPGAPASNIGGTVRSYFASVHFSNGIGYTITGGIADNDTTAVLLNDVLINIDYK